MRRYCLTLDLRDDAGLIAEYEQLHREVWPEIRESILSSGIERMQIYRFSNRLCMVMADPQVQKWENLMWKFQQAVPGSKPGEKWVLMDKIFEL
jgi:L-rhamnose mutarotase